MINEVNEPDYAWMDKKWLNQYSQSISLHIASFNSALEALWHFVMYCCCITASYDSK